jgi:hypothetical protein
LLAMRATTFPSHVIGIDRHVRDPLVPFVAAVFCDRLPI